MDEAAFQTVADATLTELMERIEATRGDEVEVDLEGGVLTIELDSGAQYLINKHGPMRQIWLSSPVSGAGHYDYDAEKESWVNSRTGETLSAVLAAELIGALG